MNECLNNRSLSVGGGCVCVKLNSKNTLKIFRAGWPLAFEVTP